ncbi:MAG: hypothetical protein PHD58_04600 [Anaerolineales bacterium]|nr:hypothetical protein [Anaerolineales bacterium]
MSLRPFDWRDLPALHRYRHQSVLLHSSLVLTRGEMLFTRAMISSVTPAMGIYTSVCVGEENGRDILIGQVMHTPGSQLAHLTFLAPDDALTSPALPALLEHLVVQMGEQEAYRLLADVDEASPAFEPLRRAGFAVYVRQRVWRLEPAALAKAASGAWQPAAEQDLLPIRALYANTVPGLVQQVEPLPASKPQGLVYRKGDDVLAFAEVKGGRRGIWVQLLVHPDARDIAERLGELQARLTNRSARPVYVCIRSYISWLEPVLEDLGAAAGPRQAVMVKHLVIPQKAARAFALPILEGRHPEVSAPIAHSEKLNSACHNSK